MKTASIDGPIASLIRKDVTARIPTSLGEFQICLYKEGGKEHAAFVMGDVARRYGVLVRIHSECFTGRKIAGNYQ